MSRIKSFLTKALPILLGLATAIFGWFYLQHYMEANKDMVKLPVAAHDIAPYTVIEASDMVYRDFVAGSEQDNAITNPQEAVGKISTIKLQKGWQISSTSLSDKDMFGNHRQIGVVIDAARSAGAKPGDLVDVYWLAPDTGTNLTWTGQTATMIAENVRILTVCDDMGVSIDEKSIDKITPTSKEPKIIYMLVKPEDVDKIIGGSGPKNASISLAIKQKEDNIASTITAPVVPDPAQNQGTAPAM